MCVRVCTSFVHVHVYIYIYMCVCIYVNRVVCSILVQLCTGIANHLFVYLFMYLIIHLFVYLLFDVLSIHAFKDFLI